MVLLYLVFDPVKGWAAALAPRVVLIGLPAALWAVLHLATWWHLRELLVAFRWVNNHPSTLAPRGSDDRSPGALRWQ